MWRHYITLHWHLDERSWPHPYYNYSWDQQNERHVRMQIVPDVGPVKKHCLKHTTEDGQFKKPRPQPSAYIPYMLQNSCDSLHYYPLISHQHERLVDIYKSPILCILLSWNRLRPTFLHLDAPPSDHEMNPKHIPDAGVAPSWRRIFRTFCRNFHSSDVLKAITFSLQQISLARLSRLLFSEIF